MGCSQNAVGQKRARITLKRPSGTLTYRLEDAKDGRFVSREPLQNAAAIFCWPGIALNDYLRRDLTKAWEFGQPRLMRSLHIPNFSA